MPTRSEILDTLAASQEQVTAYFGGLSPEELERPCTASGVPGEAAWRAKDHFAHLAENERNIQILLLDGDDLPPPGKTRQHLSERGADCRQTAVKQDQRVALSMDFVIHVQTVY